MVATPQDPHILARIARLEATVKNLTQKGLTAASVGQVILPPGGKIKDTNGVTLFQSDPLGGMAYPWYSVPLLGLHVGPTGPNSTTTYNLGTLTQAWQQYHTSDAGITTTGWFAGFLPYVSHPRLQLQTFAEVAAVGGTATFSVSMSTNNGSTFTTLGTWVENQFNGQFTTNVFDMTPYLGQTNVLMQVKLDSFTGGAGYILLQPYGLFLRGSV